MEVQLLSDLHTEDYPDPADLLKFLNSFGFVPNLDFLLLCGDIVAAYYQARETDVSGGIIIKSPNYPLKDVFDYLSKKARHIVFVAGNHEYYGTTKETAEAYLVAAMPDNFHWLRNSEETIEGHHFFCGTMWFPHNHNNQQNELDSPDFRAIQGFRDWVYKENEAFVKKVAQCIVRAKTIVQSHYIPSIDFGYCGNDSNHFSGTDLTDLIMEKQPGYWAFGHAHRVGRIQVGRTVVECNPYGRRNKPIPFRDGCPPVSFEIPDLGQNH